MDSFDQREEGFERAFTQQEESALQGARAPQPPARRYGPARQLGLSGAGARGLRRPRSSTRGSAAADDEALVAELAQGAAAVDRQFPNTASAAGSTSSRPRRCAEIQAGPLSPRERREPSRRLARRPRA